MPAGARLYRRKCKTRTRKRQQYKQQLILYWAYVVFFWSIHKVPCTNSPRRACARAATTKTTPTRAGGVRTVERGGSERCKCRVARARVCVCLWFLHKEKKSTSVQFLSYRVGGLRAANRRTHPKQVQAHVVDYTRPAKSGKAICTKRCNSVYLLCGQWM